MFGLGHGAEMEPCRRRLGTEVFPQQRELMGSSAQISSGVRRCGSQAQVPEGSGGFCKVPVYAGAGSGGRVPEGFGRCCRVPESSGVLAEMAGATVPEGLGRFC